MMILSILVVCIGVPMAFVFSGSFSTWLRSAGVHPTPNLAGGYAIAEFDAFSSQVIEPLPQVDVGILQRALAIHRFSVKKVAFRPLSGMGIEPRLNLSFDFEGQLPDPQNSAWKFSLTAIHVYIKVPGKTSGPIASDKVAQVDFGGHGWDYQVIIDGFHDQARIFDVDGNLVARGLGLYVDYSYAPESGKSGGTKRRASETSLTAALPMEQLGDPAKGDWQYYVLAGLADSRHPSMMLHSGPDGGLTLYSRAVPEDQREQPAPGGRPFLMPLLVSNPN